MHLYMMKGENLLSTPNHINKCKVNSLSQYCWHEHKLLSSSGVNALGLLGNWF